jgi:hypothetical protein
MGMTRMILFQCISYKEVVQILSEGSGGKIYLITYLGNQHLNAGRRVHSVIEVGSNIKGFSTGYEKIGSTLTVYLNTNINVENPTLKDLQRDLIMLDLLTPKVIFKKGFNESQAIKLRLTSLNLDDNTKSVS